MKNKLEETSESLKLQSLLEEVYEILNQKDTWTAEDKKTLLMLERIISLRTKKNDFDRVFDDIGEVTASMMELDFSKRVTLAPAFMEETNLFNYLALTLNLVNDELERAFLSGNMIKLLLTGIPGLFIAITRKDDTIHFVNNQFARLTGIPENRLLGISISTLFPEYATIQRRLQSDAIIENKITYLSLPVPEIGQKLRAVNLTALRSCNNSGETEGYAYILKKIEPDTSYSTFEQGRLEHDILLLV
jgi:PAS domain-containing protein